MFTSIKLRNLKIYEPLENSQDLLNARIHCCLHFHVGTVYKLRNALPWEGESGQNVTQR